MYAGKYATERADEPAFVMADGGEVVTFREYEAAANRAAHLFRAHGLGRRDHVAFLFENSPRMLELEGGAERTGLYYTCINSYLAADEVAYIVNDSDARVVATSVAMLHVARELPARCPNVAQWLVDGLDEPDGPFEPLGRRARARSPRRRSTTSSSAPRCSIRRAPPGSPRASSVPSPTPSRATRSRSWSSRSSCSACARR